MRKALLIAVDAIAVLGSTISLVLHFDPLCGEELVSEQTSPDGSYVAAMMIKNCGATADCVRHLNVRLSGSVLHRGFFDGTVKNGEILTLVGEKRVPYCWLSTHQLNLVYPKPKQSSQTRSAWKDVTVTYGSDRP
jgi:hypothetical protein